MMASTKAGLTVVAGVFVRAGVMWASGKLPGLLPVDDQLVADITGGVVVLGLASWRSVVAWLRVKRSVTMKGVQQ